MRLFQEIKSTNLDFLRCGITGWCIEVIWTGMLDFLHHDKKMIARTSLIMFPIYGSAFLIKPISHMIQKRNFLLRGSLYALSIYIVEFISGSLLKKRNMCPWDYSKCRFNIRGVIRLDYAPAWFLVGLLYEKLLNIKKSSDITNIRSHTQQ